MSLKPNWIVYGMLLAVALGFGWGYHWCKGTKDAEIAKVLVESEALKESENAAKVQAGQFEQTAKDAEARGLDAEAAADAAGREVDRLKAKLAHLTGHPLAPLPGIDLVDGPGPDTEVGVLRQLVSAQDTKITAQDAQITALEQANAARRGQVDQLNAALRAADARAGLLESQLRNMARPRPWAAGAVYGSDGMAGGSVERDLGPFRVGVDVVRHKLPGGNTTLEAVGRILVRF